jgi:uncharacterized membrane protein
MPQCPQCGNQLTGAEGHCPACSQAVNLPPPEPDPAPGAPRRPLTTYIQTGWEIFKQYPAGFAGFCLINIAVHTALSTLPRLSWLASAAILTPLLMGNFIVSAKVLQRQAPVFRDFFAGFHFFLPLCLVSLATSVLISLGLFLLIIPGVYLMVSYIFSGCLVVDRRLDFWPAMELSRRTVTPRWFEFFLLVLLLSVLNGVGALLLGLGLLVTLPLTFSAVAALYADVFGFQSDYAHDIPRGKTP